MTTESIQFSPEATQFMADIRKKIGDVLSFISENKGLNQSSYEQALHKLHEFNFWITFSTQLGDKEKSEKNKS